MEEQIEKEDNCCIKVTFAYASQIPTVMPLLVESDEDEEPPYPDFQQIHKYLNNGTLPVEKNAAEIIIAESKHFSLVDGILFHWFQRRCKKPKGEFNFVKQIALPKVLRKDALLSYDDSLAGGGHLGIEKVKKAIYRKYYWPRMHSDIVV